MFCGPVTTDLAGLMAWQVYTDEFSRESLNLLK